MIKDGSFPPLKFFILFLNHDINDELKFPLQQNHDVTVILLSSP